MLSDRFCISSNGSVNVTLSPQQMVSCDGSAYGCLGGYLSNSFKYMTSVGLVTD